MMKVYNIEIDKVELWYVIRISWQMSVIPKKWTDKNHEQVLFIYVYKMLDVLYCKTLTIS